MKMVTNRKFREIRMLVAAIFMFVPMIASAETVSQADSYLKANEVISAHSGFYIYQAIDKQKNKKEMSDEEKIRFAQTLKKARTAILKNNRHYHEMENKGKATFSKTVHVEQMKHYEMPSKSGQIQDWGKTYVPQDAIKAENMTKSLYLIDGSGKKKHVSLSHATAPQQEDYCKVVVVDGVEMADMGTDGKCKFDARAYMAAQKAFEKKGRIYLETLRNTEDEVKGLVRTKKWKQHKSNEVSDYASLVMGYISKVRAKKRSIASKGGVSADYVFLLKPSEIEKEINDFTGEKLSENSEKNKKSKIYDIAH